ncbi:MAG: PAS domain-containing protein [Verrucomicrobia bacterium]|nr:PAS domain-containing protein [Verrucomicrobiota bacterium]
MSATVPPSRTPLLLIEDNAGDASLMRSHLSDLPDQPFDLHHTRTLAEGLQLLRQHPIALVLLDLGLPDSQGLSTFSKVSEQAPEVPIIVLTGHEDDELALRTVHIGAQDYLAKRDVDSRLLARAIRYAIERKQVEDALAQERDLLHTIIDNLPDRIFIKDLQSRFMKINRSLAQRFGPSHPRDMVGKSDADFFSSEHAEIARRDEQRIIETGQPILDKVERETLPDGTGHWVITSKLPLRDKQQRLIGTFGISRDITQLKETEEALASERNLLRSLIDHLPDYIYAKDDQCRYTLDNEAHRRLLGVSRLEEILGKKVTDFFPARLAGQYDKDDQTIVRTGVPLVNHEEPAVDRLNNQRWHCTSKIPLRDANDQVNGLVCITRDITDTRLAQERLEKANSELARSREELMRALTDLQGSHRQLKEAQGQLIQAEKMQSIGRLAAGVAHEVKNPLAIIRMGLDHLGQEIPETNVEAQLSLRDMREAVQRADGIILGLLDFAKPRELNARPQDLNAVVEQAVSLVRFPAKQSKVKFVRELAPHLPEVWIDPDKLKQVLVNVFANAIHAMGDGGSLTVRTKLKTLDQSDLDRVTDSRNAHVFHQGDRVAMIEVKDNGPGIPPDKLAHIYDPFFTTKEPGKGTGLGLTVTRRLIEMHGGTIDIRNRKNGGVAVTIWLKV